MPTDNLPGVAVLEVATMALTVAAVVDAASIDYIGINDVVAFALVDEVEECSMQLATKVGNKDYLQYDENSEELLERVQTLKAFEMRASQTVERKHDLFGYWVVAVN